MYPCCQGVTDCHPTPAPATPTPAPATPTPAPGPTPPTPGPGAGFCLDSTGDCSASCYATPSTPHCSNIKGTTIMGCIANKAMYPCCQGVTDCHPTPPPTPIPYIGWCTSGNTPCNFQCYSNTVTYCVSGDRMQCAVHNSKNCDGTPYVPPTPGPSPPSSSY